MLSKTLRVDSVLFKDSLKLSRRYKGHHFSLSVAEFADGTCPHIAFVVPGNLGLNAVKRNKLKRQMRAATYSSLDFLLKDKVYLIFARPGSWDLSYTDIRQSILELIKKCSNN